MTADARLERLIAMHGLELARHLRRMVRNDDDAQDLLQDTFLRAHKALAGLAPDANARAWLYRIATNVALNHVRGRSREGKARDAFAHETVRDVVIGDGWLDDGARRAALWTCVAALPERQRVALTLRVADELDYAAIGARMGTTAEAARANVHQATKKLRVTVREA